MINTIIIVLYGRPKYVIGRNPPSSQ